MFSLPPVRNSKSPIWIGGSNHGRKLESWKSHMKNKYCVKENICPPCLQQGTLTILKLIDDDRVVLDTLLFMLECRNLAQSSGIKCKEQI